MKDFAKNPQERKRIVYAMLSEKRFVTNKDICEACHCSAKTAQRTVNALRDDRWPIDSDHRGYFFRESSIAEKSVSADTHFGVLMLAGCSIDKNIASLFPNVSQHFRSQLLNLDEVENTENALLLDRAIDVPRSIYTQAEISLFGRLSKRIIDEVVISFDYVNVGSSEQKVRTVFPIQLRLLDGVWFLLSWDLQKQERRAFKLLKIKNLRLPLHSWDSPSSDIIESVINSARLSVWETSDAPQTITIEVKGHAKEYVELHKLTSNQKLVQANGVTQVTFQTSDTFGTLRWCREYIHDIKILKPQSLIDLYLSDFQSSLAIHKT